MKAHMLLQSPIALCAWLFALCTVAHAAAGYECRWVPVTTGEKNEFTWAKGVDDAVGQLREHELARVGVYCRSTSMFSSPSNVRLSVVATYTPTPEAAVRDRHMQRKYRGLGSFYPFGGDQESAKPTVTVGGLADYEIELAVVPFDALQQISQQLREQHAGNRGLHLENYNTEAKIVNDDDVLFEAKDLKKAVVHFVPLPETGSKYFPSAKMVRQGYEGFDLLPTANGEEVPPVDWWLTRPKPLQVKWVKAERTASGETKQLWDTRTDEALRPQPIALLQTGNGAMLAPVMPMQSWLIAQDPDAILFSDALDAWNQESQEEAREYLARRLSSRGVYRDALFTYDGTPALHRMHANGDLQRLRNAAHAPAASMASTSASPVQVALDGLGSRRMPNAAQTEANVNALSHTIPARNDMPDPNRLQNQPPSHFAPIFRLVGNAPSHTRPARVRMADPDDVEARFAHPDESREDADPVRKMPGEPL